MLPLALRQAFDTMTSGRPGPVNIDVPFNVYQEEAAVELPAASPALGSIRPAAAAADLLKASDMLKQSQRPVLFIGHGATLSEAGPAISALSSGFGIPVITSPNGMGCVPAEAMLTLGFIGRNGAYPANQAGRHADLVITLGTRFDDRSSSSWHAGYSWNFPHCKLIHVDIDPQELGRNYAPDLSIVADVKTFVSLQTKSCWLASRYWSMAKTMGRIRVAAL
jgi:acetolactate synthase-1/2/3 large subunit